MGRESFSHGVQQFLKNYSNAVTDDLWTELQSSSGPLTSYNISFVMETWTRQMRYPVLTSEKQKVGSWILSQEKVKENRNVVVSKNNISPFGYKWEIPLSFESTSPDSSSLRDGNLFWIRHEQSSQKLPITGDVKWKIKQRPVWLLPYRVNYGPKMYDVFKKICFPSGLQLNDVGFRRRICSSVCKLLGIQCDSRFHPSSEKRRMFSFLGIALAKISTG
jgi:hypothetical protein